MSIFSIFKNNNNKQKEIEKVNVLSLKANDYCYYGSSKEPFKVVDVGTTNRGIYYVEIKNTKNGKAYIFTDTYYVRTP